MSVHLVGGGSFDPGPGTAAIWAGFRAEAAQLAVANGRAVPRIAVVTSRSDDPRAQAGQLVTLLEASGVIEAIITVAEHGEVPRSAFADVDGVMVGGGHAPTYREVLEPRAGEVRRLVASGVPYLGFSAGAMIAAEGAIIGGNRIGGVVVASEAGAEGLDEITVAPGLGLIDVAVDAHVAQWGTLSRLVAAVEAGIVDGGLGIDEDTALVVGDGGLRVVGVGSVWRVLAGEQGVLVSTMGA